MWITTSGGFCNSLFIIRSSVIRANATELAAFINYAVMGNMKNILRKIWAMAYAFFHETFDNGVNEVFR